MKVMFITGRLGTRLAEEAQVIYMPMVQVSGIPILSHIMSSYAHQGFTECTVAIG